MFPAKQKFDKFVDRCFMYRDTIVMPVYCWYIMYITQLYCYAFYFPPYILMYRWMESMLIVKLQFQYHYLVNATTTT